MNDIFFASAELVLCAPGLRGDERSLLGERVAAVGAQRSRIDGKAHTGQRSRVDTQNRCLKISVTKTKPSPADPTRKGKAIPIGMAFLWLCLCFPIQLRALKGEAFPGDAYGLFLCDDFINMH